MNFDIEFQKYLDLGRELTAFYFEERYPPGPITEYSKKEIEKILNEAEEVIEKVKKGII